MNLGDVPVYVDCVVQNKDGSVRIGRLNHDRSHWQLATYQVRVKGQYCWAIEDVAQFKTIPMEFL